MPELNGKDTFLELKKINPDIKAILCSGFNLKEQEDSFKELGIKQFLEKPFTLAVLAKVLWEHINN